MQSLSIAQYQKVRKLSYKQVRRLIEKQEIRARKDGGKWVIDVHDDDIVPGVDNRLAEQPQLELGGDNPSGESEEKKEWALRKLKAEALNKEQSNDNFLFSLLHKFLNTFSTITIDGLRPLQQYLQTLPLERDQVETINRRLDEFAQEFEEKGYAAVEQLFEEIVK